MTTADTVARAQVAVGRPHPATMIWRHLRHDNRAFWRSPIAAFFTVIFPLLFLVLLGALIGNEVLPDTGGLRVAQFLTPAIAAFAATTASFTSLAIGVVIDRDEGILKRARSTPLAPWMFMVSRIGSTVWVAVTSVALMIAVGVIFFDVQLIARTAPAAIVAIMVGIRCFAALGLAVVSVAPSQSATQALTNAFILPLAFISDVFSLGDLPPWLERVGWFFPLKHFVNALGDTFNPFESGAQFAWDHLAVLVAWGSPAGSSRCASSAGNRARPVDARHGLARRRTRHHRQRRRACRRARSYDRSSSRSDPASPR